MLTQVWTAAAARDRLIVIEGGGWRSLAAWCEQCGAQAGMIRSDDFASASHVSAQAVERLTEAGAFHGAVDAEGVPLICMNSPLKIVPRSDIAVSAAH